ncbi:MAG: hypothetical protein Q8K28_12055 [Hoeflea sp.]|uniref:hypothetical protein n=1 Tax=Hoeflea sp. TaxID=1940281 RepID=UPI0027303562|nr:hypothetical protein [Hoeflea sp.]MDP2120629.1 hypothetical protein [Hoeflea sp.]
MGSVERKADWRDAIADPHLPLHTGTSVAMRANWRFALVLIFLGTLFVRNPPGDGSPGPFILIGSLMTVTGIYLMAGPFLHKDRTVITIDEKGVLLHLSKSIEPALVPWSEVQGVERTSFARLVGKWLAIMITQPCLIVSREFYDRSLHVDSLWKRGPGWHLIFVPDKSGTIVRIVVAPDWFGWPKRRLFEALALRWRHFGPVTPEALAAIELHGKASALDRFDEARARFMSRPMVRPAMVGLVVIGFGWLWLKADDVMGPGYSFYFDPRYAIQFSAVLLDDGALPARLSDGRMVLLSADAVTGTEPIDCNKERVRNPDGFDRATRTMQRVTCTMQLEMADGSDAIGIMRVQHQFTLETPSNTSYASYVIAREVPVSVDLSEAETLICDAGLCR